MSDLLTEINKENIYPETKEEILNIEKNQIELQKKLEEQIKSTEEKLNLEKKMQKNYFY